jgi:predicted nucleic acid-binding protein
MASQVKFLDTHGFFAWLNSEDPQHARVVKLFTTGDGPYLTTDWIVGETCNLLVARRRPHLVRRLFQALDKSCVIDRIAIDESRFQAARALFERFEKHAFPLTDCTSFVVMREFRLKDALTADRHFRIMGFNPILAD